MLDESIYQLIVDTSEALNLDPVIVEKDFLNEIYIKTNLLPKSGELVITEENYVYLKVSDEYIHIISPIINSLYPFLSGPNFLDEKRNIGAHISIAYPHEIKNTKFIADIKSTFYFSIDEFFLKEIEDKIYCGLMVKSIDLDFLRAKNHLPKMLNYKNVNVAFHITLATSK